MQGAWGKRALSAMAAGYKRNWNNLRGAWGKREMPLAVAKGQSLRTLSIIPNLCHHSSLELDWRFLPFIMQASNGHESASLDGTTWKVFGAEKEATGETQQKSHDPWQERTLNTLNWIELLISSPYSWPCVHIYETATSHDRFKTKYCIVFISASSFYFFIWTFH